MQNYIKDKEDSPWAVSLRDVSRFCKLLVYFNDCTNQVDAGVLENGKKKKKTNNSFRRIDVALALSIYFCYIIRMSTTMKRQNLISLLS